MRLLILSVFIIGIQSLKARQIRSVDFKKIHAEISIDTILKKVSGSLTVYFKVLKDTNTVSLDAINMEVLKPKKTKLDIKIEPTEKKINFYYPFISGQFYQVGFDYHAFPKQSLYFIDDQVWTQGQGKYTSHWLPSIDDMNDKIEFDLSIKVPHGKTVIANGKLINKAPQDNGNIIWHYNMEHPMASYLVALAIGDFDKKTLSSESGIPIHLYYKPNSENYFEPTYRYTKQIFDFLESETGVAYPWQNYKQVPVKDFLYAGMENTTATFFSEAFITDSIGFLDRNYVNVNAHEMAHHWFGNLLTETSGKHHWLQEGFATYYALLAERELFGDDYFYWKLLQSAEDLKALSDQGKGEALLNPKASSLTFYQKGAWALHILKEIVGEQVFKKAIRSYLQDYSFKNVSTSNFIDKMEEASGLELDSYVINWLKQTAFKANDAFKSLKKSPFIMAYFKLSALREKPLSFKEMAISDALRFPVNDYIGQEAVYQLQDLPIKQSISYYKKALETNNIYVRQALAQTLTEIPKILKEEYETLLDDDSYATMEAAFYNLWFNFPENRSQYLDKMKGIKGFNDRNIELLWLVLALHTQNYHLDKQNQYLNKLRSYTHKKYGFELRQRTFNYLKQLNVFNSQNLSDLMNATQHHSWRFKKFSRQLLDELLKDENYKKRFNDLLLSLDHLKEIEYLKAKLK